MKTYKGKLTKEKIGPKGVYVYGANTEFRHGRGSAKHAKDEFGAIYGLGGHQGQSYAIITKDLTKYIHPSVSIEYIKTQIHSLYVYAELQPDKNFYIAYSGEGINLNAYTPMQMADMFYSAYLDFSSNPICYIPENIVFEEKFAELIHNCKTQSLF